jgi:hypothetical protein
MITTAERLVWVDDEGVSHILPNMPDLDPRTRATLVNLRRHIYAGTAILKRHQAAFGNFEQARDVMLPIQIAVDRFLRMLLPGIAATAIAQRDLAERNAFLTRWFIIQLSTTFPTLPTAERLIPVRLSKI